MASNTQQFLDFARQIVQQLKNETRQELSKEQLNTLENFKEECRNYIRKIDKIIQRASDTLTLQKRILLIGELMHPQSEKISIVHELTSTTLDFEEKLNQYLGRTVAITWINTKTGNVKIADYKDQLNLFNNGTYGVTQKGRKRSYRSLITGVNEDSFKQLQLNAQLKDLQQKIDRSIKNRSNVYTEALRRYDKSISYQKENDKEALELKNQDSGFRGQYWRVTVRGDKIHWRSPIASRGFIGQGYISLILKTSYNGPKIVFDSSKMPDYILEAEQQIEQLAIYAQEGDSVPGALQGDIKYKDDGSIQLAVKQGSSFHTAAITIDIAIAYAFLTNQQSILLSPENLTKSIDIFANKFEKNTTQWQAVYDWLVGIPLEQTKIRSNNMDIVLKL